MLRDKSLWSKEAILMDILLRLGKELASIKLWEHYILLTETVGSGCELAEKAANLLTLNEKLSPILNELKEFYGK